MTRHFSAVLCAFCALLVLVFHAGPAEARTKVLKPASKSAEPRNKALRAAPAAVGPRKPLVAAGKPLAAARMPLQKRLPAARVRPVAFVPEPPRLTMGQQMGLHSAPDPLELRSSVALVVDEDTNEILVSKNSTAVLPIASITKLMTALLVIERAQPLEEPLTVTDADVDTEKNSPSRLVVGTTLNRGEMLHLALMSSENRAAHALGRHYPGGLAGLALAMNRKAAELGMRDTKFVEPTGLSSLNRSSARDLAVLVKAAHREPLIRELSTSHEAQVSVGERVLQYRNTNGLIGHPDWTIGLQKTGYIAEAGRCLVMQAQLAGRRLIMVFLDSAGRYSRLGDAERIRRWLDGALPDEPPSTPVRRRAS